MKAFAALYRELDATTSNLGKQAALQRYLQQSPNAEDRAFVQRELEKLGGAR